MQVGVVESVGSALTHSLALEVRDWLAARVVTGYAMTECQPVTCPPFDDPLGTPGSVNAQLLIGGRGGRGQFQFLQTALAMPLPGSLTLLHTSLEYA